MVDWYYLPILLLSTLPLSALTGWVVYRRRMHVAYMRGRQAGWKSRVSYEESCKRSRGDETVQVYR